MLTDLYLPGIDFHVCGHLRLLQGLLACTNSSQPSVKQETSPSGIRKCSIVLFGTISSFSSRCCGCSQFWNPFFFSIDWRSHL
ncbi:hypothetical protein ACOSP7_003947 [Xanthoceras sorbifolium]